MPDYHVVNGQEKKMKEIQNGELIATPIEIGEHKHTLSFIAYLVNSICHHLPKPNLYIYLYLPYCISLVFVCCPMNLLY